MDFCMIKISTILDSVRVCVTKVYSGYILIDLWFIIQSTTQLNQPFNSINSPIITDISHIRLTIDVEYNSCRDVKYILFLMFLPFATG